MASLTPIMDAFYQGREQPQREMLGQLQQAQGLVGILSAVQQQQQRQRALAREQAYRGALSRADTDEKRRAVALEYGDPKDILGDLNTRAKIDNTKEIALGNLQQKIATEARHAYEFAQTLPLDQRRVAIQEINSRANAAMNAGRLAILRGDQNYNVGSSDPGIMDAISQLRSAAAGGGAPAGALASPQPTMAPQLPAGQALQGSSPSYNDAMAMFAGGGGVPRTLTYPEGTGPSFGAAPAPQAALAEAPPVAPAAPNNLDARDLGAHSRGPVIPTRPPAAAPAPAPAPQPAAPVAPVMPPEIAKLPKRYQDKWVVDQAKTSIAGAGRLTPDALKLTVEQYLAGDRQAFTGYARDQNTRGALQNELAKQVKERGWDGKDIAAQMADFAGIMSGSRTVGTRAAQIELAANEAVKMMDIVSRTSKAFKREDFIPWNQALKAFETNVGRPEVKNLGAAINSLVNVYARAINPNGVATVSDKDHAREMLRSVDSPDQVDGVLGIMREEMQAAQAAPIDVRRATREAVTGRRNSHPNTPEPEGGIGDQVKALGVAYEPEKYEYRVKNGTVQRKAKNVR